MGCDIHGFIEEKIDGVWYTVDQLPHWRNYDLFGHLAGVRSQLDQFIEPRGLPEDASVVARTRYEAYGCDAHSAGWLSNSEVAEAFEHYQASNNNRDQSFFEYFGFDMDDCAGDIPADERGEEYFRLVFFFDN